MSALIVYCKDMKFSWQTRIIPCFSIGFFLTAATIWEPAYSDLRIGPHYLSFSRPATGGATSIGAIRANQFFASAKIAFIIPMFPVARAALSRSITNATGTTAWWRTAWWRRAAWWRRTATIPHRRNRVRNVSGIAHRHSGWHIAAHRSCPHWTEPHQHALPEISAGRQQKRNWKNWE